MKSRWIISSGSLFVLAFFFIRGCHQEESKSILRRYLADPLPTTMRNYSVIRQENPLFDRGFLFVKFSVSSQELAGIINHVDWKEIRYSEATLFFMGSLTAGLFTAESLMATNADKKYFYKQCGEEIPIIQLETDNSFTNVQLYLAGY